MSANRLTIPIVNTKRKAALREFDVLRGIDTFYFLVASSKDLWLSLLGVVTLWSVEKRMRDSFKICAQWRSASNECVKKCGSAKVFGRKRALYCGRAYGCPGQSRGAT